MTDHVQEATQYAAELAQFQQDYPDFDLAALEKMRAAEYSRLDELGHVYLDYTGGGLYAEHQIDQHTDILKRGVYGNPHSSNPTSMAATTLDEGAREYVLQFFNADPNEYVVIFTPNASGALKLVGESYPFEAGGRFLLTFDNHNSVNGIREFARNRGADFQYAPVLPPELRIDADRLNGLLAEIDPAHPHLFAYPAQSNFSGVKHSLDWIEKAQALGWDVLLDAAAFAPTNRLDLRAISPDFVSLSFYKIFGYPTGVGCLIAKKSALEKLHRPWFAGGTITVASVQGDRHFLDEGESGFEDGTIDYLNLPAVEIGLRHIERVGVESINARVTALSDWLIKQITALRHSNGAPLITLYGPANTEMRGGTITVNFYDSEGRLIDYADVEAQANARNISLRTGCFCNPGASEKALGLTREELDVCFSDEERMSFEQFMTVISSGRDGEAVGAVRISVGIATNFADVYQFVQFARTFLE